MAHAATPRQSCSHSTPRRHEEESLGRRLVRAVVKTVRGIVKTVTGALETLQGLYEIVDVVDDAVSRRRPA